MIVASPFDSVFDNFVRKRLGPPLSGESRFRYLNESARQEAIFARAEIDSWFAFYPKNRRSRLVGDFRSSDDGQHISAFFELFLFRFFKACGWSVVDVEPSIEGVTGNPDFLIENDTGQRVVVEAISPSDGDLVQKGCERLVADIRDALNNIKSEDHYLIIEKIGPPVEAISKARLKTLVQGWLQAMPRPDDVFVYEDKGAIIHIRAMYRPGRDVSADDYGAIGIEFGKSTISVPGDYVKRGLTAKAKKYRGIEMPYLIAMNARRFDDTEYDYIAATYGTPAAQISISESGGETEAKWVRNADGLFNDGGRPRKRHVSGALLFNGVTPWSWRECRSCLIPNAYAGHRLEGAIFGGEAFVVQGDELRKISGGSVGDVFDRI